ncbi:MAG: hypothetical protein A2Z72_06760 [Omnitrophica bacterium RBG_13_46_9]|nr:MAG: hypothetical protein A2Z72_06760 [Omnitrophica bacterium RBG_13_46_9]
MLFIIIFQKRYIQRIFSLYDIIPYIFHRNLNLLTLHYRVVNIIARPLPIKSVRIRFTHEPESHACKGADEWLSVQGSAPPIERNPVKREATAVRRWSFTLSYTDFILLSVSPDGGAYFRITPRSAKSRLKGDET